MVESARRYGILRAGRATRDPGLHEEAARWAEELGVLIDVFDVDERELQAFWSAALPALAGLSVQREGIDTVGASRLDAVGVPWVEVAAEFVPQARKLSRCAPCISGRGMNGHRWALRHLVHRHGRRIERLKYGTPDDCHGELWWPDCAAVRTLMVLLHGGFWREPFRLDMMQPLAANLADRGHAVWNVEYRRVGESGGGMPHTLEDVASAIDFIPRLGAFAEAQVVVVGHSAGGQLALWHRSLPRPGFAPRHYVALAPVCDLADAYRRGLGDDAVVALFGGPPDPSDLARACPSVRPPREQTACLLVHGASDQTVPVEMSRRFASDHQDVTYREISGARHMSLTDPLNRAWQDTAGHIEDRLSDVM